ncbi:MAG: methyltransferase domain-containing protein [Opitutaceae bacterium]
MHIILDEPRSDHPVDPNGFAVRGWVWLGDVQPSIAAVEIWSGDTMLGATERIESRPDVVAALSLPAGAKTGFVFTAHGCRDVAVRAVDLFLRIRLRSGSRMGPFCSTRVTASEEWRASSALKGERGLECSAGVSPPLIAEQRETEMAPLSGQPLDSVAVPPDHLQLRQIGCVHGPLFYSEGRALTMQVAGAFRDAGRPLEKAGAILDFGCGCGRVLWGLQHLPVHGEVWGSDLDTEAIAWNRTHLGHLARFQANAALPPARFRDGQFDAIYAISVFTHLPEEMQFAWLAELRRLLRPGGIFLASLHGAHYWRHGHPDVKAAVEARGFDYRTGAITDGLPDFYMVAYHSENYVRTRWSHFFDLIAFKEKYIAGLHDAAVMRRRED